MTSNEFLFNRSEKEVEALGKVTLDEVKAVLEPLLKERKISVQVKEAVDIAISGGLYYIPYFGRQPI